MPPAISAAANVSTYNIRFYQARYVQGVIAGKLSKAGLAGYVGSVPVPEVVQGINAFMLGMQSINPKAKLKFVLINSWYDPPKEGDAAKALIDQGCDIITQHTNSPAPLQAAASRGIKAFGQSTDMSKFAPTTELTASTDVWGPYYIKRIGDVMDGTWKSTDTWGGFDSGMLAMSPFTNMPDDVAGAGHADRRRHQVRQEQDLRRADLGSERRRQGARRNHDGRWRPSRDAVAGPGCGGQTELNADRHSPAAAGSSDKGS